MGNKKRITAVLILLGLLLSVGCAQQPQQQQPPITQPSQATVQQSAQPQQEPATPVEEQAQPLQLTQQQVIEGEPTGEKAFNEYFQLAKAAALTPGLMQDYIPQGLCVIPDSGFLAVSYYTDAKESSILALVGLETGEMSHWVTLKNVDGTPYTGHAGGIASDGINLWVTSDGNARRLQVQALLSAKDGDAVRFEDSFPTGTRASLANYSQGILWVGDFFTSGGSYDTDKSHHMKTPDNSKHYAWAVGFIGDTSSENGLKADTGAMTVTPDYVLSLPARIQGLARLDNGSFVLSESYGRKNNSHLLVYEDVLALPPDTTVQINGTDVPLWFLDSRVLKQSITAPPMSEGIDWADGGVYQLYESGSTKFRDTGKFPVDHIYRVELN